MPFTEFVGLGDWTPAATYFVGGGVVTASLVLATEWRYGRVVQQRVTAGLSGCWALLAAVAYLTTFDWQLALPAACWSILTLLAVVQQHAWFERALSWGLRPAVVWVAVLAASVQGAIAIPWLSHHPQEKLTALDPAFAGYRELSGIVAVTDQGRMLPLAAYEPAPTTHDSESDLLTRQPFATQVIRLFPPSPETNCHGWVFTGGRHAIPSQHVESLLSDNRYTPVETPEAGDVVIYRTAESITHTGLVKWVDERGHVFVESKWGPLGVYLHPVLAQPYGSNFTYYRTNRPNHLVIIRTETGDESPDAIFATRLPTELEQPAATLSDETAPIPHGKPHQRPSVHREGVGRT
ncbi:MAG: hypothetical protein MUF06_11115 [Pirellulaceae bacterium]|nr:hypothetical protein [Pirellulaceae bacterium]